MMKKLLLLFLIFFILMFITDIPSEIEPIRSSKENISIDFTSNPIGFGVINIEGLFVFDDKDYDEIRLVRGYNTELSTRDKNAGIVLQPMLNGEVNTDATVLSMREGIVAYVGEPDDLGLGHYVIVYSADGLATAYTRLKDKSSLVVGNDIQEGDVISTIGNSFNQNEPTKGDFELRILTAQLPADVRPAYTSDSVKSKSNYQTYFNDGKIWNVDPVSVYTVLNIFKTDGNNYAKELTKISNRFEGDVSSARQTLLAKAESLLGVPYVFGGTTTSGLDCSGFSQLVYKSIGMNIPRNSLEQYKSGKEVALSDLKVGDLVYNGFGTNGSSHIMMYIGDGEVIEATTDNGTEKNKVMVSKLELNHRYKYGKKLHGFRLLED